MIAYSSDGWSSILSGPHTENLNTPRLVADDTQKTVWKWEQQEPFGAGACNPDPDGDNVQFEFNLRFPGQYFDRESNLHYNWFRNYDSGSGRYEQSEFLGLEGGLNTYEYAGSNPIQNSDPDGLRKLIPFNSPPRWERLPSPNYYTVVTRDAVYVDTSQPCEAKCYVRAGRSFVVEEAVIHGAQHAGEHIFHKNKPMVGVVGAIASAIGIAAVNKSLQECLAQCDDVVGQCRPGPSGIRPPR